MLVLGSVLPGFVAVGGGVAGLVLTPEPSVSNDGFLNALTPGGAGGGRPGVSAMP